MLALITLLVVLAVLAPDLWEYIKEKYMKEE